jgi:hypothetical protein
MERHLFAKPQAAEPVPMKTSSVPLNYAHHNPRRRLLRRTVGAVILALMVALFYEPAVEQTQSFCAALRARSDRERYLVQCLRHTAATDAVAFNEAPLAAAADQLTQVYPGTWAMDDLARGITADQRARRATAVCAVYPGVPSCLTSFELANDFPYRRMRCVSCLRQLAMITMSSRPPASRYRSVLFLHGRHSPGGPERLVCVTFDGPAFAWFDYPVFETKVFAHGRWRRTLQVSSSLVTDLPLHHAVQPLRLFAGQPDPRDESHFTIHYTRGSESGTIDGRLRTDDSVRLQLLPTPLSMRSS